MGDLGQVAEDRQRVRALGILRAQFRQGAGRIATKADCDSKGNKLYSGGLNGSSACTKNGNGVTMCPDQLPFYDKLANLTLVDRLENSDFF